MTRTAGFFSILTAFSITALVARGQVTPFPTIFNNSVAGVYVDPDGTLHQRQTDATGDLAVQRLRMKALNQPPAAQDLTYVSLPKVGTKLSANGRFGEIESVKATSDLYSGVSGTVTEINTELSNNPGLVNTDPYTKGWMLKIKVDKRSDYDKLLSGADYLKKTGH